MFLIKFYVILYDFGFDFKILIEINNKNNFLSYKILNKYVILYISNYIVI